MQMLVFKLGWWSSKEHKVLILTSLFFTNFFFSVCHFPYFSSNKMLHQRFELSAVCTLKPVKLLLLLLLHSRLLHAFPPYILKPTNQQQMKRSWSRNCMEDWEDPLLFFYFFKKSISYFFWKKTLSIKAKPQHGLIKTLQTVMISIFKSKFCEKWFLFVCQLI